MRNKKNKKIRKSSGYVRKIIIIFLILIPARNRAKTLKIIAKIQINPKPITQKENIMNRHKVISVDHGNRHIKTLNHVFAASFMESGYLPNFDNTVLKYQGKEYILTDGNMPQKMNKTEDISYFILTLFAIGKELKSSLIDLSNPIEMELLAGLPPLHFRSLQSAYIDYFKNHGRSADFELDGAPITIRIKDVHMYPQAYAATFTIYEKVKDSYQVNIVDIGGFTVDCLQLTDFRPDMDFCDSIPFGVNMLFDKINIKLRAKGERNISYSLIEKILRREGKALNDCSHERLELIRTTAESFTRELLSRLSHLGLDLNENRTVFIGGGSILLKTLIENSGMAMKPIIIDDICANVKGYRLLFDAARNS